MFSMTEVILYEVDRLACVEKVGRAAVPEEWAELHNALLGFPPN
jgi:hypothetical protein